MSDSSAQSILTKNVALSFGIHLINELEFSLNEILGELYVCTPTRGKPRESEKKKFKFL